MDYFYNFPSKIIDFHSEIEADRFLLRSKDSLLQRGNMPELTS